MKGKDRVLCSVRRGQPDRVPVLPQIWLDHAARVSGIDPLAIIERPELGMEAMLLTARHYGIDGFRVFANYSPRRIVREEQGVYELDPKSGAKHGIIDIDGGWRTRPFKPSPPFEDPDHVTRIPVRAAENYWDSGFCGNLQRIVQEAAADHAVVGRPLGFTMNWLQELQGSERALLDLYD